MLGLINYESLQVDVDTKVEDPLVNLHEDTSSTARTKSKDHVLENDQTVVEPNQPVFLHKPSLISNFSFPCLKKKGVRSDLMHKS